MPHLKITKSQRWAEDGITNELLEAGKTYEVSIDCAQVFEAEEWGEIVPAPEVEENAPENTNPEGGDQTPPNDDDPDTSGSGENGEGTEGTPGSGEGDDDGSTGDPEDPDDPEDPEKPEVVAPRASPKAISEAEEGGVDLRLITGTGKDGAITVQNVREHIAAAKA